MMLQQDGPYVDYINEESQASTNNQRCQPCAYVHKSEQVMFFVGYFFILSGFEEI
jgi:hypothetical protein